MNEFRTGRRGPTSRDVAKLAGVAQSTVSYVINGRPVAEETRQKVEKAMRALRYQPNAGARALRTSRTNVIALVVHLEPQDDPNETVPYVDNIVALARERDYDVLLSPLREGSASLTRMATRGICDAFVLMDVEEKDERVAVAAALGLPTVLIGRPDDAHGLDSVDLDARLAGSSLVDELVSTGHRCVKVLEEGPGLDTQFRFLEEFVAGARESARRAGVEFDVVVSADGGWDGVRSARNRLLGERGDRVGLVARTSQATQWLMNLCQLEGVIPGRDVSIVSRCTDELALAFAYPVTNVSPRPRVLSEMAMGLLFERIDGASGGSRAQLVAPGPVTRRSTTAVFG